MEVIIPIVIAIITSVVGPAIVEWVKKRRENKPKDPLGDAIQHNEIVEQQLDNMLKELECDQIYIAQFHNGGHFYPTGKSIQKFSIFYEVTTPDAPSIKGILQNIPVSLFSKSLSLLYEKREIAIEDTSTINLTDLDSLCHTDQYKSVYLLTLTDLDDRIIGIIGIYYIEKKHKLTKEEWIFIRQKIGTIGNLLSNYLYNKKN